MNKYKPTNSIKSAFRAIKDGDKSKFIRLFLESEYVDGRDCDTDGSSFLYIAIKNKRTDIADFISNDPTLLRFNGTNGIPPSFGFYKDIDPNFLKFMTEKGMDINASDQAGNTMLHNLAKFGTKEDYIACLALGAEPNSTNEQGKTPFDIAERFGKKDLYIQACNFIQNNPSGFSFEPKQDPEESKNKSKIEQKINRLNNLSKKLGRTYEPNF